MPATEAPPAPAATPAAAPPTSASPPPSKPTLDAPAAGEKPPSDFMSDMIGDFEAMDSGKPDPSKSRDAKTGKFKPKEPEQPAAKKPDEKPTPKPEETPPEEKPPTRMRELGQRYDDLKKQVEQEYKPEIQRLRSKVQEFESKAPEDNTALMERVKGLESRNAELERHMEYVDYTKSGDFNQKYQEPYRQAWAEAVSEFKELLVREASGEDEMGEPQTTTRPATEADLIKLGAMTLSEMDEAATKMFGASASRAINHIQNLRKLNGARMKALEEAQGRAGEWKTRLEAEGKLRNDALAKTWMETTKSLEERLPKAFKPEEGDEEDKAAFTRGFAMADLLFLSPEGLTPEQVESLPATFRESVKAKQPLSESQKVQLHALARLKMANHDRLIVKLKKAQERLAELEKTVSAYEKSEPDASRAGSSSPKVEGRTFDTDMDSVADDFRKMDRG